MKTPKHPSTYRGVPWNNGRWVASIRADGRQQHLGTFDTEEAAARVFDEKAKQLHANPTLNFLPDGSLNRDRKYAYVESNLQASKTIDVSVASCYLSESRLIESEQPSYIDARCR